VFGLAATFAVGAAVLALEMLAWRVLAPVVGATLTIWTAVLTTTLAGLALGAYLGGRMAAARLTLSWALTAAGALTVALALLGPRLADLLAELGTDLGAFAGAALLVGAPCVPLAMVGPAAAERSGHGAGRAAGLVCGASSAGSIAGALLAGYVLIPGPGLRAGYAVVGAGLLALSAAGHLFARRRAALLVVTVAVLPALFVGRAAPDDHVVLRREGPHGRVEVRRTGAHALLLVNGIVQTEAHSGPGAELPGPAGRLPELRPRARTALVIGLGAGAIPTAWTAAGLDVTCVEIDPAVVAGARFLGFGGRVVLADARTYLRHADARFDVLLLDAFASETLPFHLFSREAMLTIRARLEADGLLMIHLVAEPRGETVAAIDATARDVFPEVLVLTREPDADLASVWVLASAGPLEGLETVAPAPGGRVLTDDRNPLDRLHAGAARRWRKQVLHLEGDTR